MGVVVLGSAREAYPWEYLVAHPLARNLFLFSSFCRSCFDLVWSGICLSLCWTLFFISAGLIRASFWISTFSIPQAPSATMMEPLRRYDSLDHVESSSSTEVDESSLMGDEKHRHHDDWQAEPPRSLRQEASSLFLAYRWILDTSLLLVILVLLLRDRPPPPPQWEVGSDFTGVAPKCTCPLPVPPSRPHH